MARLVSFLALFILLALAATLPFLSEAQAQDKEPEGDAGLLAELKTYQHKIVYESNRDGNFELYLCNADGSNPVNLTNTKDIDEMYPKPSPDGTKICFVADEGQGNAKKRNIYYMNSDGTGRVKVAVNPAGAPTAPRLPTSKASSRSSPTPTTPPRGCSSTS